MAEYSIMADMSAYLLKILREHLCPEIFPSPTQIDLGNPADKEIGCVLGIYLYHMSEEKDAALPQYFQNGAATFKQSPKSYRLSYMLFINSSSGIGTKEADVQKIMGRAAQVIQDNSYIYPKTLQPWLKDTEPPVILSQAKISFEDKVRVWQAVEKPYRLSLFYDAAPILISSNIEKSFTRVSSASFHVQEMEEEPRGKEKF